jgi:hypothetical protein
VTGTVDDGAGSGVSTVTVTITLQRADDPNENADPVVRDVDVSDDGTFSVDVDMDGPTGSYAIAAAATDAAGHAAETTRDVSVYTID